MSTNPSTTNHTLADLSAGQVGVVTELHSQGPDRRRMMDLGIVPGTLIRVEKRVRWRRWGWPYGVNKRAWF